MKSATRFTTAITHHGEGPFWDSPGNRLLCMDVLAGAVVEIDSAGTAVRHPVPSAVASAIRRRDGGGFVIATEHGVVLADDELLTFEILAELPCPATVRTNDGGCDPFGAFVIGTMAHDAASGRGSVYRVQSDGQVTELLAPVSISNGVQWSADGTRVYYIDTPTRRVDVFDVDLSTGAWTGRRPHIYVEDGEGMPDGMAIDEDGGLWIAMWGGGEVRRYDGHGRLMESIAVPGVSQVSSCAFGGEDRNILYITTSRQDLDETQEPDAGAVFVVATDVRGAVLAEFAG